MATRNNIKNYPIKEIPSWDKIVPSVPNKRRDALPVNYAVNTRVSLWGDGDRTTDKGDITKLQVDCIVNAAKSDLTGGGGIDGIIWNAAGETQMREACKKLNGCAVGKSKFTPGFNLPAKFVLHTVGPQDKSETKLRCCYESCLENFLKSGLKTMAFCCVATGVYDFPNLAAAHIALSTTRKWLESHYQQVSRIIFCVWEPEDVAIYTDLMTAVYFRTGDDMIVSHSFFTASMDSTQPKDNRKRKSAEDDEDTTSAVVIGDHDYASRKLPISIIRKKKKAPAGCCIKKLPGENTIIEEESYLLFSKLPAHDLVKIHYGEIKSDIMKHDEHGFYYKQAKNVQIIYSDEANEKMSIRLDNLLDRGFPLRLPVDRILTKTDLDVYIQECPTKVMEITGVQSDIDEEKSSGPTWKYRRSALVTVFYVMDEKECSIRLNNLRERGFPCTQLKYYSFLHFKIVLKKMGKSVDEIKNDEAAFMDCLQQVNVYFIRHPDVTRSQEIEEFRGPQSYADCHDSTRFHYYGKGSYRYYRRKDLVELLQKDFEQVKTNEFMNDPVNSQFLSEDRFIQYLHEINDNISRNKNKYHHLFVQYSGPQCYEDLYVDPDRLNYDVNYKQHAKRESELAVPKKNTDYIEGLHETFENSRFSLRVCIHCDQIRALGLRAAQKYPLCYYEYQGRRHFINFRCNQLHGIQDCDQSECDIAPVMFDDIQLNGRYILYVKEDSDYVFGYLISVSEMDNVNQHLKFDVVKAFGSNAWIYNDYTNETSNWLNNNSGKCWQYGSLSKSGRWKVNAKSPSFNLSKFLVEYPHEAKSSQVFYDTHIANVDHDDPAEKMIFCSLLRVRNCHKLLSSLKLLYCVKCKRTLPGLEAFDNSWFMENGSFDKSIKDIYLKSQVVNATNMFLDQKFNTSDAYSSSDVKATGVCTECSPNYSIDDSSKTVDPIFLDFADSQSESSQDESSSQDNNKAKIGVSKTNVWGPENLFTLDLFDDDNYACFMRSLTVAERLVITPLHILINVYRCRSTQMPHVTNSSIAFPIQNNMETNELPWTGFRNLPFIVVIYNNGDPDDSGIVKEAKINLEKIVRARDFMTQRFVHPLFPNGRPRYRFVEDGFCTFTDGQMMKLRDELLQADSAGYAEPIGLRKVYLDETSAELKKTVPKQQVQNWMISEFPYAESVYNGCLSDEKLLNEEGNLIFELFWSALKKFIFQLDSLSVKEVEDEMVTYDLLFQFADSKGWVNIITNNVKPEMLEEFSVLASCFTNDEGPSFAQGCVYPETTNDPDEIYRTNIQNTALDRRRINVDRAKKAAEWQPGYLAKAFPHIFLSGDADFHQPRPIPINQSSGARKEYLRRLCMLREINESIIATFTINILMRKLDAFKAATVLIKDVDLHNERLPTKQQLLDNPDDALGASKLLMQYASMTIDSPDFWKLQLKDEIGTKRDLEYMNEFSRPDKKHPTDAALFRTSAPPYRAAYYFHRLFSYGDGEDISNINHRRAKVLSESMVIEWVGTLLAELDIKYLAPYRCPSVNYVMRYENGKFGNPHHHSLLYSDEYGEINWNLKVELEKTFDYLCEDIKDNSENDTWTEDEKKSIVDCMLSKWNDAKQEVVDFFSGMYSNWNPCFTGKGESTGTFPLPDITTINPADIVDNCLASGDMTDLDRLYCGIVNFHCRHIVHRGKNGKPAKTDYCYREDTKKDKKASLEKGKAVYKNVVKCSRRKPQDKRAVPAIHVDAHDKKLYQVTFQSNDEWFNGADPFLILLVLGNADTKALVQPAFTRKPKFVFSETDFNATMTLYISPGDSAVEYIIKYMGKAPIRTKTNKEIYMNVSKKMEHAITESGVYQCYTQAAIQGSTSLLSAQHINLNLPLVQRDTQCKSINVTGRKSLKVMKDAESDDYLNESRIDEFEARLNNLSPYTSVDQIELQGEMSMREFFDKYSVSWDKQKRLIVRQNKRLRTNRDGTEITMTTRLTPHTTMIQANPNRDTYGMFCKKMCLWAKRYDSIRRNVPSFSKNEEAEENIYWIQQFNTEFPNGEGLETTFKAYVQHYAKKNMDTDDDDDDDDDEADDDVDNGDDHNNCIDDNNYDDEDRSAVDKSKATAADADAGNSDFYQTADDLLLRPGPGNEDMNAHHVVDEEDEELVRKSEEYMANANLEDFMAWLPKGENTTKAFIEMQIRNIMSTCGAPVPTYPSRSLTQKQELSRRIIMNWIHDRVGERKLKPLRLFVLGLPGVGKTFSFKITATEIMNFLGDEWTEMVRIATPTGAVASHVGYNAQTLHRTFYIRVGHEDEDLKDQIDRITELKKRLPKSIILIVFDECSMLSRFIFAIILNHLKLAALSTDDIGFVMFGDPAQIPPVVGKPMWCYVADEKDSLLSLQGINDFRHLFRMKPLTEVKGYRKLKYLSRSKKSKYHPEYLKYYREVGQKVYEGEYNAVYMDEVMRTDNSKASEELKSIHVGGRYGAFSEQSLSKLQSITATQSEIDNDPEWEHRTSLTGFHYHSDLNPERCTADSMNATSLVHYSNTSGRGIMKFEAIHSPAKESEKLVSLPAKEFQNIASKLYLAHGCRVILTRNINFSAGLFNGAPGKFIGPLYLPPTTYEVTSLEVVQKAGIGNDKRTTKQIEVKVTLESKKQVVQIPKGALLSSLNGKDEFGYKEIQNLQEPFTAQFEIPRRPPFLPEYLVVEFPGYADKGGHRSFKDPALKDYVYIKPFEKTHQPEKRHNLHRVEGKRTNFPIELAYTMTHFKGIGANHTRTELDLREHFDDPGGFLVGISRVVNPKHLFVKHWPSALELNAQRLKEHVLQSENFERFIRIKSARDMRYFAFDLLHDVPTDVDQDSYNNVADQIYQEWSNGVNDEGSICGSIAVNSVVSMNDELIHAIYALMKESDEYLVTKDVPHLSNKERYYLGCFKENKRKKGSVGNLLNIDAVSSTSCKRNNTTDDARNQKRIKVSAAPVSKSLTTTTAAVMLPRGLCNIGNTCFINSVLQLLRPLSCSWSEMIHSKEPIESKLCEIMNLLKCNQGCSSARLLDFKNVLNTVMRSNNGNDTENEQQDVQEAMTKMFDKCVAVPLCLTFWKKETIQCKEPDCNQSNDPIHSPNHFLNIHPVRENMSLQECIDRQIASEEVTITCEKCGVPKMEKVMKIATNPSILLIQVTRQMNADGRNDCVKLDHEISINECTYNFKSAIQYDGYVDDWETAGHYITYAEVDNTWFKFNDSHVERVTVETVENAASNFYILCYKKNEVED